MRPFRRRSISQACLCIWLAFFSAPAFPTYDDECIRSLLRDEQKWLVGYRFAREAQLHDELQVRREFSDVEAEAAADILHGLVLFARFTNGKRGLFAWDYRSAAKLSDLLRVTKLDSVQYLPASIATLRKIFTSACEILKRKNCEVYATYTNLSDDSVRPFTKRQELALKWATVHMAPSTEQAAMARDTIRKSPAVQEYFELLERPRQETAQNILLATFSPVAAERLYTSLAQPYIAQSYKDLSLAVTRK
jgi:hypothetical protein